jgi:uncharacterized protein (UPF0261 family)
MPTVVLLGTLDTKGKEYDYLRSRVLADGCNVILIDAGILGSPLTTADISREEVAAAAHTEIKALAESGDRGAAVQKMAEGATAVVLQLFSERRLQGILGLGGSGGSSLVTRAMQALPVGIPKLMVSTMASGDTRPYVGSTDITMMYSVVDIAGINRISERILSNAAAAIAGMAKVTSIPAANPRPLIAATMFGVTTPCVNEARQILETLGYEVLVFHATGTGGLSMEGLIKSGFISGVLDITTTELADELVGGVLSAGPHRLEAAGASGLPQVVSLGALDMVNFGPIESVPAKFQGRKLYKHNATVTLMRTTSEENAELGKIIGNKLNMAHGPLTVFIPRRGVSAIDIEGQPFYDADADQALFDNLKATLRSGIDIQELDMDINYPRFAQAMAHKLDEHIRARSKQSAGEKA